MLQGAVLTSRNTNRLKQLPFGRSKQTGIPLTKFQGNPCMGAGETSSFVSHYITNVDAYHVSFTSKKKVIKKLSPNSVLQTYMKRSVRQN